MIQLINMPFASVTHPSLALGQFKAQLAEEGVESKVYNFNQDFAYKAGIMNYELLAKSKGFNSQIGEWLFAFEAWGKEFGPSDGDFFKLCDTQLNTLVGFEDPISWLRSVREEFVPTFLDYCCDIIVEDGGPDVVAFTCTFFQTVASLALARRLKLRVPDCRIAFGGACFHGEMGVEIINKFPFIDAVSIGEADNVFVPLCDSLKKRSSPKDLQGILFRCGDAIIESAPHVPVTAKVLEHVPAPDYSEYFEDLERTGLMDDRSIRKALFLPFESSRGCWWGEKQHCTFCGLNNEGMSYRMKSPERALEILKTLFLRYDVRRMDATDNILPIPYFKNFLPSLKADQLSKDSTRPVLLFYEVKSNLSRDQVKLLADAQVRFLQPGIESLATPILDVMRKGVKGIQNVYLLKLCRTYDLYPLWNVLYGFPGETPEDYEFTAKMIPKLVHFLPPFGGPRRLELHRFSPYFFDKDRWTSNLRPREWYRGLFPEDIINLSKVAYYFDADWHNELPQDVYEKTIEETWNWIDIWSRSAKLPKLIFNQNAEGDSWVEDSRFERSGFWRLGPLETQIYNLLDDIIPISRIHRNLGKGAPPRPELEGILTNFVNNGLAIEEGGLYLGLALQQNVYEPSFEYRNHFFNKVGQRAQRALEGRLNQELECKSIPKLTFEEVFTK